MEVQSSPRASASPSEGVRAEDIQAGSEEVLGQSPSSSSSTGKEEPNGSSAPEDHIATLPQLNPMSGRLRLVSPQPVLPPTL